jgi:hypothetical protein
MMFAQRRLVPDREPPMASGGLFSFPPILDHRGAAGHAGRGFAAKFLGHKVNGFQGKHARRRLIC